MLINITKEWIKKNLFNGWYNSILTIISILFIYQIIGSLLKWAIFTADWTVLQDNLRLFFVGTYPEQFLWRIYLSLIIVTLLGGISWGVLNGNKSFLNKSNILKIAIVFIGCLTVILPLGLTAGITLISLLLLTIIGGFLGKIIVSKWLMINRWLLLIWLIIFCLVTWLVEGGIFLEQVKIDNFSGLILTLYTAIISIVLCFPFGILLALGRQSKLIFIRWLSTGYIEIIRALPLIGILFMAQVMLPLILPPEIRPDRVIRAICGFIIFASAYLAENIRGGLQSVPKGQTEAAKALGLNTPLILTFIILPQAIKAVIPAILGQFISLFKDTSLLAIVGLIDLLGMSQSILANPKFIGKYLEVYLFIALIYWLCCYTMSLATKKIENG
jgi:general L-amino acid transport system permease protein